MKLVEFSVERYRSIIQKSTIQIKDKTVIIGPNNEGKSNVLRALVLASRMLENSYLFFMGQNKDVPMNILRYHLKRTGVIFDWNDDYPHSLLSGNTNPESLEPMSFSLTYDTNKDDKKILSIELNKDFNMERIAFGITIRKSSFLLEIQNSSEKYLDEEIFTIADYVTKRNTICYIETVRTASSAYDSIKRLLEIETANITGSNKYQKLLKEIYGLYEEKIRSISSVLTDSLKGFVPSINQAKIEMPDSPYRIARPSFFENDVKVLINDGEDTPLEQKGSGIQSLIALALAHTISVNPAKSESFVLAIEEPEAHLHPKAIHEIKKVLSDIAKRNQLIITTHSPLLAETVDPHKNIIVKENKAFEASKIAEIRKALGVIPADNLSSAELVLIVEGAADENMLPCLMGLQSDIIKNALEQGRLIVSSCGGTDNMDNYVRFMRYQLCNLHVFVDDDEAGRQIINKMRDKNIIEDSEYTILKMDDISDSEIENMIDPDVYADALMNQYGISISGMERIKLSNAKWSDFMERLFSEEGKIWEENNTIFSLKTIVSQAVKKCNELKLIEHRARRFVAGCQQLERKLNHEE